jgi:hypothetical protein
LSKKSETIEDVNQHLIALNYNQAWSEVEQAEIAKILQTEYKLSRQEIANVMGLTLRQVQTRLVSFKAYAAKGLIPTGMPFVSWKENPRETVIKDEEERIARGYANAEAKEALDASIFEERFAAAVAKHIPTERNIEHVESMYFQNFINRMPSSGSEEAAVAVMSDWHYGLENSIFNAGVAQEVINRFVNKTIRLTELHRTQCPVKTLYFCPIGDNLQGSSGNFPAQRWTVHSTAVDQAEVLTGTLVRMIERWLIEYDKIIVYPRRGNHGNLYPKKVSVEPDHANIETVVHRTLRWIFKDNPRVEVHCNDEEWYTLANFMGVKALLTHGDAIPGAGSFDGILGTFRKLNDILPTHDIAIMGHFHRRASLPMPSPFGSRKPRTLYLNGTAVLGDTHGEQYGAAHSTQWWNLFVNNERVTAEYAVSLYD